MNKPIYWLLLVISLLCVILIIRYQVYHRNIIEIIDLENFDTPNSLDSPDVDPNVNNHIINNSDIPTIKNYIPYTHNTNDNLQYTYLDSIANDSVEIPSVNQKDLPISYRDNVPQQKYPSAWCKVNFDAKTGAIKSLTHCKPSR